MKLVKEALEDFQNSKFYIEKIENGFNLWQEDFGIYYCRAGLFFNDPMCGTEWTVDEKNRSVSYKKSEIKDEIENPLELLAFDKAQYLLNSNETEAIEIAKNLNLI
ncbi:MAG: hypothetical protein WC554_15855 [Clostridia bacterium]